MSVYERLQVTPNTPEWYEVRRTGLGATDSAAILGLAKWSTPLDVYRSKMGVERDFDPMLSWIGHNLEPVIGKWIDDFATEIGSQLPGFAARSLLAPHLLATPDSVTVDGIPIEKKTSMEFMRADWADGVPLYYQVQSQQQQFVLGAPYGWLVVFHGGRDFEVFRVDRDDDFIENHLIPKTLEFWESHVLAKVAPEPSTLGEVAEVWPSESRAIVGSELVLEVADQRAVILSDIRAMQEQADALTLAIAQYMETADTLTRDDGTPVLTYKTQQGRESVSVADIRREAPELAEALVRRGEPFKVMRTIKEKK